MMKVALLSFHNAYNYGAALQAYGLQYAVQKLGTECEYLDYQNNYRKHAYDMKYQFQSAVLKKKPVSALKALIGIPIMRNRARKFDEFYNKYLQVTDQEFTDSRAVKAINKDYDKFIVGSDQVWNYSNNGGDTAYLLDFVEDDTKKISYSSSFGVSSLSPEISNVYGKYLRKFSRLATRESIGTEIIESLTGRKAHLVLDPVFLAGRKAWEEIRDKKTSSGKDYIFFYTNRQSQITDFLNTGFAEDEEFHVLSTHITFKEILNSRIKQCISISPQEFLEEISSAKLVVTASFHCLALAIIFHKQFVVILTGDHGKDERITNLLRITGLESRVLKCNTTKEDINKKIDYSTVDARIKKKIEYSEEYLKRAIFDEPDLEFDDSFQNKFCCQDSRCFGCNACESICPTNAISLKKNEEGFLFPVIDESKCVKCYRCHEVCQVYTEKSKVKRQNYYAVKNIDKVRMNSSSGGVFQALAKEIFKHNGFICAAAMLDDFTVKHIIASNEDEIRPMCGTYYVQSAIEDCFKRIKTLLLSDNPILFVGTACQIKGLKDYLGTCPENLYTCDVICHGVPSPMVFEQFIHMLEDKGQLTGFRFRDKSLGWKGYHVSAIIDGKKVKDKLWLQSFNNLFSHNMINRLSCGSCPYTNYERPGDLTIGDFWGIEKSHADFSDPLGVSLVITSTEKGEELLNKLELLSKIEVKKEETQQNSLLKPAKISAKRMQVFQTIVDLGYGLAMRKYAEANCMGKMKNIVRKIYVLRKV